MWYPVRDDVQETSRELLRFLNIQLLLFILSTTPIAAKCDWRCFKKFETISKARRDGVQDERSLFDGSMSSKQDISFSQCLLQSRSNGRVDFSDQETGKLLYFSSKPPQPPYAILIRSSTASHPVARLVLCQANILGVVYVLYGAETGDALAVFHYMMPSIPRNSSNKTVLLPPRIARIALPRGDQPRGFEAATARCIRRGASLEDSSLQTVLRSRTPTKDGKQWTLDFGGRGQLSSNKNMAMMHDDGKVVLQIAAWDSTIYHADYDDSNVTPLLAFAFALAQLDL